MTLIHASSGAAFKESRVFENGGQLGQQGVNGKGGAARQRLLLARDCCNNAELLNVAMPKARQPGTDSFRLDIPLSAPRCL